MIHWENNYNPTVVSFSHIIFQEEQKKNVMSNLRQMISVAEGVKSSLISVPYHLEELVGKLGAAFIKLELMILNMCFRVCPHSGIYPGTHCGCWPATRKALNKCPQVNEYHSSTQLGRAGCHHVQYSHLLLDEHCFLSIASTHTRQKTQTPSCSARA